MNNQPWIIARFRLGHRAARVSAARCRLPHRLHRDEPAAAKIMQEIIALSVFMPFAVLYMKVS
jgi:uncharacterized protein (DUF486 family)